MSTVERSALVPWPAQRMYELVLDVPGYGEFLPWCREGRIIEQNERLQRASIIIDVPGSPGFTTVNQLTPHERIEMKLEDGPFRHLGGCWQFTPIGDAGCRVELVVEFEFASSLVAGALRPAFLSACDSLVGAFARRAAQRPPP